MIITMATKVAKDAKGYRRDDQDDDQTSRNAIESIHQHTLSLGFGFHLGSY